MQQRAGSLDARGQGKRVIGSWHHFPWQQAPGALHFVHDAGSGVDELRMLWLDRHVRGEQNLRADEPPVALFVMGVNGWGFFAAWQPLSTRATRYDLHTAGRANSLNGHGTLDPQASQDELPDLFTYDTGSPVLSVGGHSC